jgi:hypothetical protein
MVVLRMAVISAGLVARRVVSHGRDARVFAKQHYEVEHRKEEHESNM